MTVTAAAHRPVRHHPVHPQHPTPKAHPHHHTASTHTDGFTSGTAKGPRSAARTNEVLNRLDVQHNRRYLPTGTRGTS